MSVSFAVVSIFSIIKLGINFYWNRLYASSHSFSNSEIPNFTVVPKWSFVFFLQRNAKFRIVPKRPFVLWLQSTKCLKLFRNFNLLFDNKLKNLKLHRNCHSVFDHEKKNSICTQMDFRSLTTNNENRNLMIYFLSEL